MITYRAETKEVLVKDEITCDCCGKTYSCSVSDVDIFEVQEFLNINFIGGYSSIFGDGVRVSGNFCQECVKELLGKYLHSEDVEPVY